MEYNSGKLKCPKCNQKAMSIYTNWLSRKTMINDQIRKQWIFYYKTKAEFTCPFSSGLEELCNCSICRMDSIVSLVCCPIFTLIYFILYILIFAWIDICLYCNKKDDYSHYYLYMNIADFKFIIKIFNDKFDFNLWDKYEGITEEDLIENGKGKNIFNCYKCC